MSALRRLFVSTSNCACLFNAFRDGISSSSSDAKPPMGIIADGNGENNLPAFARIVLPSVEVTMDIVSSYKIKTNFYI
jgi:hypothetical protein